MRRSWLRRLAHDASKPDSEQRSSRWEVTVAVLLGAAALATAFAAYQAELRNGDSILAFNEAAQSVTNSNQIYTQGNQAFVQDQALFLDWAKAQNEGDEDLAAYFTTLMSEQLTAGIEWWQEQDVEEFPTPFVDENPEYVIPEYAEGERLDKETEVKFAEAKDKDKEGDQYTLATVILAAALFLFGIAGVSRGIGVRLGTAGAGVSIFVIAIVVMASA